MVVSAVSGVTNLLETCMNKAKVGDLKFKSEIDDIFKKHIGIINQFVSKKSGAELTIFIEKQLNKAEKLLKGISLVNEITPNIYSKIIVIGEMLSSKLMNEIFINKKLTIFYRRRPRISSLQLQYP